MYIVLWEFIVREGQQAGFKRAYGEGGEWIRLFERMQGYLGSELLHDEEAPERYINIDRWTSAQAYREFRQEYSEDYDALDLRCEELIEHESFLGAFVRE